jgi:hypothetical protein
MLFDVPHLDFDTCLAWTGVLAFVHHVSLLIPVRLVISGPAGLLSNSISFAIGS